MTKRPLVAIVGPTASGKTAVSVELAKRLGAEIVSADSMQIYKRMEIATAKPTEAEMGGVRHHLIDFLEPCESFSVARYCELALLATEDILKRGRLPILCGGTGLYVTSFIDNIWFEENAPSEDLRRELTRLSEEQGGQRLLSILREFDPETAERLHKNNITRIIRAIEVYRTTGVTMSELQRRSRQESLFEPCMIGLGFDDRELLYQRINLRVDRMLEAGLLEEAERVFSEPQLKTAVQAIGYKELKPYFDGSMSLDSCIERLKQSTRHYAKRQLTWFRRDKRIHWIMMDRLGTKEAADSAMKIIEDSGVLKLMGDKKV